MSHVFADVFRRADKNDDGTISLSEFKDFFADGVLSEAELGSLFSKIDADSSGSIDTKELAAHFTSSGQWATVSKVFEAIGSFNVVLQETLNAAFKSSQEGDVFSQFALRFLLKEVGEQIGHLQRPLLQSSAAMVSSSSRNHVVPYAANLPAHIAFANKPEQAKESGDLHRLAKLVDRLTGAVKFDFASQSQDISSESDGMAFVVRRKLVVQDGSESEFLGPLKQYALGTRAAEGAISLTVRHISDSNEFLVFEVWSSSLAYKEHFAGEVSKLFRRSNVDTLAEAASESSLEIPAQWVA